MEELSEEMVRERGLREDNCLRGIVQMSIQQVNVIALNFKAETTLHSSV